MKDWEFSKDEVMPSAEIPIKLVKSVRPKNPQWVWDGNRKSFCSKRYLRLTAGPECGYAGYRSIKLQETCKTVKLQKDEENSLLKQAASGSEQGNVPMFP